MGRWLPFGLRDAVVSLALRDEAPSLSAARCSGEPERWRCAMRR